MLFTYGWEFFHIRLFIGLLTSYAFASEISNFARRRVVKRKKKCLKLVYTCDTVSIMAQQKPAMKLVAYIICTFTANTVSTHDTENGTAVASSTFRLPNFIASPPKMAPNKAPSNDRLATHEACWLVTVKTLTFPVAWMALRFEDDVILYVCGNDEVVDDTGNWSCSDAIAGELYPLPSPAANGPSDTANVARICIRKRWNINKNCYSRKYPKNIRYVGISNKLTFHC